MDFCFDEKLPRNYVTKFVLLCKWITEQEKRATIAVEQVVTRLFVFRFACSYCKIYSKKDGRKIGERREFFICMRWKWDLDAICWKYMYD